MEYQYKKLNKELVEQVQEMRNTLKEYRDEILYLRSKAMDADIKYLHLSSKVSSLAKIHFENLMVEVDPMSPILSCLRNGIGGTYNAQPTSSISSRQSSRLAEEMRRSSSVVQTRRSFNSVSPIRATNTDAETQEDVEEVESIHESPQNTCGTLAIREEDEEGEEAEHYTVERDNEVTTTAEEEESEEEDITNEATPTAEEKESEEEEMNSDESSEACDSIENLSQTFNQLTTADEEIEPSPSSVSVRTLRDVTNTKIQANISADSPKRKNITVARGRRGRPRKKRNDAENNNSGTLSIEDIRHITRTERQLEASYRISIQEGRTINSSPSFSMSDITMENFRVENSSTPRHTIHRKSPENMLNATCNRPMRRCKPTSLVEKNVKSKIRNETAEKSLSTKRK